MAERADDGPAWLVRRAVKAAVAGALGAAGANRAIAAVRRREAGGARVIVLSYHRVTADFARGAAEGIPSMLVSAATLRRQLEQVARSHDLVSLSDAVRILGEPRGPARRDVATVTFDDGYADNLAVALPVLRALGVPATVYVATGFTGTRRRMLHDRIFAALGALSRRGLPPNRISLAGAAHALYGACARPGPGATLDLLIARLPHEGLVRVTEALEERAGIREEDLPPGTRLLDWDELRALDAAGVEVAGHSVHHAVLANLPLAEARREIEGCRDQLAERLGKRPRHFAYPNGYHTPAVRRAVAAAGFETAVTTEDRENLRGQEPFALHRKVFWENSTLGPAGYSPALAACAFGGVFHALRLARTVDGERPDAPGGPAGGGADPERAAS